MARAERARKEAKQLDIIRLVRKILKRWLGGRGDQDGWGVGLRGGESTEKYMFVSREASQIIRHHKACLEDSQTPANILRRMPWDAGRQEPVV